MACGGQNKTITKLLRNDYFIVCSGRVLTFETLALMLEFSAFPIWKAVDATLQSIQTTQATWVDVQRRGYISVFFLQADSTLTLPQPVTLKPPTATIAIS